MKKLSPNAPCPCGSRLKYKKCCRLYHQGARAKDALTLMRSRYSAYAAGDASYIIRTTHPKNPDYRENRQQWRQEITQFCRETAFLGLEIVAFDDGEEEAFVTFKAKLSSGLLYEKSRFRKEAGAWLYLDDVTRNAK